MKRYLLLFILYTTFIQINQAQEFVLDEGNYLNSEEKTKLEQKLKNYDDSTSTQIAIRTINSLNGANLEEYSVNLAQSLGIGQKAKDNGILILLVKQERKIRIEVGYGLEDKITDIKSKRIIRDILAPNLKSNQNFKALDLTIDKIIELLVGTFKKTEEGKDWLKVYDINLSENILESDFIFDTQGVFTATEQAYFNRTLRKYAQKSQNYIWILTGQEYYYSTKKNIGELFTQLKSAFPKAKNYTLLYLQPTTGDGNCGGCTIDKLNDGLLLDWKALPEKIHTWESLENKLHTDIFFYYFNGNGKSWFYPGVKQGIYLLQKVQDNEIGVEEIKPAFWYAKENDGFIYTIILWVVLALPFVLAIVIVILKKIGGISIRFGGGGSTSYGSRGSYGNSYSGGSGGSSYNSGSSYGGYSDSSGGGYSSGGSSGGGYSSGGSSGGGSFGGGSFGGGGASGDY